MSPGPRPMVSRTRVVLPMAGQPLVFAWREAAANASEDALVLCGCTSAPGETELQSLMAAAAASDAVVGVSAGLPACVLVRRGDLPLLALLRNRSSGRTALRDVLVRLRQRRRSVAFVALAGATPLVQESPLERLGFSARRLVERLGWFGFVTGAFSRTHRNAEVWEFRRSSPDDTAAARCPLCGADADSQRRLRLSTSEDLLALGDYTAVLCTSCAVARTDPLPRDTERVITPDVGDTALTGAQRRLMRRFIAERVARVRPLLPRDRRPRVADVGGGACAFANALAATACDVVVFEPNPANSRFADSAAGVRFAAAAFDEIAAREAGIADGSLDAITMWHSLEHVPDPGATLALARRLLRPGGMLYVCVPNLDALQSDLAGTRWCYADIPHHVTHFTIEGLDRALRRAGFVHAVPRFWNAEYELFGFYQSMLNMLTRSHNYFYNRSKKGTRANAGAHPAWTRLVTTFGPVLLPFALVASWWAVAVGKPACAELRAVAPE